MNKRIYLGLLALLLSYGSQAQSVPSPGPVQEVPIILRNATLHLGNGKVIEKGDLLILNGKIEEVGTVTQTFKRSENIDCAGKHVYPGLILPATNLGLTEIDAVRSTKDFNETGLINPNARALIGLNTDSRVIPTVRSNGILLAQVAPKGGLLRGTSSVVQLDAWNWEDAAYLKDDAVHLRWPRSNFFDAWWAPPIEEQKKQAKKSMKFLKGAFDQARNYLASKEAGTLKKTDLRWDAMAPVLKKEKPLFIEANSYKEISMAIAFSLEQDIRMVLMGGKDCHLLLDLLKEHQIPVVYNRPHNLPRKAEDPVDLPYRIPSLLKEAGVLFCLAQGDGWDARNLPFHAGTSVAYGLDKEEALQSITLDAARILGIDDRTGSLEVGKDGNIVVSKGDLLDMRTSVVEMAMIQGRKMDLGNRQKDLYEKFKKKYEN